MINYIPVEQRHFTDMGWLKTYWLFSFADYLDPENLEFGNLRVFNDDVVAGMSGFPEHPHAEMEIVTIVLEGEMTHKDSTGTRSVIRAGDVQRMSAGEGIEHSEFNESSKPVHFYQIWIHPDTIASPGYDQKNFTPQKNTLTPLVSKDGTDGSLQVNAKVKISRLLLDAGKTSNLALASDKGLFVYVTKGSLIVNGQAMKTGDQARISDEQAISFHANEDSDAVVIEVQF